MISRKVGATIFAIFIIVATIGYLESRRQFDDSTELYRNQLEYEAQQAVQLTRKAEARDSD